MGLQKRSALPVDGGVPTIARATILLVEDDPETAFLLKHLLTREGFEILYAADGREAEAIIQGSIVPDLVLTDIMLPYKDGFELIRSIRSLPAWQDIPIIMLSGRTMENDIARALDAGANDYLTKPIHPTELFARLRRFLCVA